MANVTFQSSVPATAPAGTIVETVDQGGGVMRQTVGIGNGTVAVSSGTFTLSSNPTVILSSAINVSFVGIPIVALSTQSSNIVAVSSGIITLSSNPTVIQSSALQISSGTITLSSNPTVIASSAIQVTLTSNTVALSSVATVTLSSNPTITSVTSGTVVISNGSNLANVVAGSSAVTSTMSALVVALSTLGSFSITTSSQIQITNGTNTANVLAGSSGVTSTMASLVVSFRDLNPNGQALSSNSAPVVIASNQSAIPVTPSAAATGGATNLHFFTSTATPAANLIKASAGTLYGVQAVNISSIPTYLKLYNASTSATSVGTTTPLVTIPVPSVQTTGAGISAPFPVGIAFGTAISYALTGASSDTDTSTTLIGTTINVQFA